jgi:hypothetical protein
MATETKPRAQGDGAGRELERSDGAAIDLLSLPRLVLGALADLQAVAQSVRVLPEVAGYLRTIEARVESMDREVARMRQAVEELHPGVDGLREAVDRLEPGIEDLRRAATPMRRIGARFRRQPPLD